MKTEFESNNLSSLMIDLYKLFANERSTKEIHGLSIKLTGFDDEGNISEDDNIRQIIDNTLVNNGMQPIKTVANTIFPLNLWNPTLERNVLYERYNKIYPQLKKCPANKYGLYFERMINYDQQGFNQIENIINFYSTGNLRRSAYQVSIWDPIRDQKNVRMRGFPCLQHLVVSCVQKRITLIAFYATQFIFERGYGNFLGLCNLAKFLRKELGLPVESLMCYVGVERLNTSPRIINSLLAEYET